MTKTNEFYTNVKTLADRLDVDDAEDTVILQNILSAVSRFIDRYCGRHFYYETQTRYYTAEESDLLRVEDLLSVTTLKTDEDEDRTYERTWSTSDYDLMPLNASTDGEPYTRIEVSNATSSHDYAFPTHTKGIEIAGSFGYATSIPDAIEEACLLMCERLFRRKDAIFGVMGSIETGMIRITDFDPDVLLMLRPFKKMGVGAI